MRLVFITLCLLEATALGGERFKVAVTGFRSVAVNDRLGNVLWEQLAQQMGSLGVEVVTSADIAAILGLERQKQLLGCADESTSCTAELAGAMGADGLLTGSLAKVGRRIQVNLRVIAANNARTLASYSQTVETQDGLPEAITEGARKMAAELAELLAKRKRDAAVVATPAPAPSAPRSNSLRGWLWLPLGVGAASTVGSGVSVAIALAASSELHQLNAPTTFDPQAAAYRGRTGQTMAWACAGVAAAGFLGAATLWFWPDPSQPRLAPTANGVAVQGRFP